MKQQKIIQKANKYFNEAEKHAIIRELLETRCTKAEIWEKYTGQDESHFIDTQSQPFGKTKRVTF